jgi:hypothetical protein
MKKIILPLLLFTAQFAIGQLSNLNLESWTNTANGPEPSLWTYDDGTGTQVYGTYNIYTPLTTSKITGAQAAGGTGSSAKLQTILDVPGFLYQLKPFSGTVPQSVSFSFKNQTAVNDTSFVKVIIFDASYTILEKAYLQLYSSDNNSNWHIEGIPFVNIANGTPAFIEFYAQSSISDYPTVSGSTLYIDNIMLNNCATPIVSSFTETTCQPYVWNGQTYSTSGSYSQTFVSQNGCDSTATLNLSVINPGAMTAVPDPVFEQKLINLGYDPCGILDGFVPTNYIDTVTSLTIGSSNAQLSGVSDLTGIEDFLALETLIIIQSNLSVNGVNLSSNTQLKYLKIRAGLTSLNLSQNTLLEYLNLSAEMQPPVNQIGTLDLSSNVNLQYLYCNQSGLTTLNLPTTSTLILIDCGKNALSSINLSNVPNLISLNASLNNLIDLGASSNNSIQYLDLKQNYFSGLNLSNYSQLKSIDCSDNELSCLRLKNGNNNQFSSVKTQNNFNLTCIEVDDSTYSANNPIWNTGIDTWSSFNNDCPGSCFTANVEEYFKNKTVIYPNPAYESISIEVDNSIVGRIFSIVDISGKILLNGKIESTLVKVDVRELTSGIYFVHINGENSALKLIIE